MAGEDTVSWTSLDEAPAAAPAEAVTIVHGQEPVELSASVPMAAEWQATPSEWERLRLLGAGGMGEVYEAQEPRMLRTVAVKVPRDPRFEEALLQEALILSALEHPNILPVYAVLEGPTVVLRKVGGTPWSELIANPDGIPGLKEGEDPLAFHVDVLLTVCDAMAYAHSRDILHRDLKPDNVMVGDHGEVLLLDWGLAVTTDPDDERPIPRACDQTRPGGTPGTMAPEQASGGPLTPQTDVFGLGAMLHEVLTGQARHPGASSEARLAAARHVQPVVYSDDVDIDLAQLANELTAAEPADRPATVREVQRRLGQWGERRTSRRVAMDADDLLGDLREAQDDGDLIEALGLIGEVSATCRRALQIWPENPVAKRVLTDVRRADAEVHLALDNLTVARAKVSLLDNSDLLRERLEARRAEREAHGRERAALEAFASDNDRRVGRRARILAGIVGVFWVGALCSAMALIDRFVRPVDYPLILAAVAVFSVPMVLFAPIVLLLDNRWGRANARQYAVLGVLLCVHWGAAAWTGLPMASAILGNLMLSGAAMVGSGVAAGDRSAFLGGAAFLLGVPVILLAPGLMWEVLTVCSVLSFGAWTLTWVVDGRARSAPVGP